MRMPKWTLQEGNGRKAKVREVESARAYYIQGRGGATSARFRPVLGRVEGVERAGFPGLRARASPGRVGCACVRACLRVVTVPAISRSP